PLCYNEEGWFLMSNNYTYGYARVSTQQQDLSRQVDLLKTYNCNEIFTEKMTGTKSNRPELDILKGKLRPGDMVVVESFSRLGRSTKDLIDLVIYFEKHDVKLISDKENFDTSTPQGRLMITVFQAFSQYERDLIIEYNREGLQSAKARGRKGGRPRVKQKDIDNNINLYNKNLNRIVKIKKKYNERK